MKPGPTGTHATPAIYTWDNGELQAVLLVLRHTRQLMLNFGTMVSWLAYTKADALEHARVFRQRVQETWGEMSYDASTLPFRIVANQERGVVETYLPTPMQVLLANPEVFLAWAQCLEEAVAQLKSSV